MYFPTPPSEFSFQVISNFSDCLFLWSIVIITGNFANIQPEKPLVSKHKNLSGIQY